jgi:hypothetical protein
MLLLVFTNLYAPIRQIATSLALSCRLSYLIRPSTPLQQIHLLTDVSVAVSNAIDLNVSCALERSGNLRIT